MKQLANSLKIYARKHWLPLSFLLILIIVSYANSLNNQFVSDDIYAFIKDREINQFSYVTSSPHSSLRRLPYFIIYKLVGLKPIFYRLVNLLFHTGSVWLVYILFSLMVSPLHGLLTASLFAVHPIEVESVTWISGGVHSQYAFFLIASLLFYALRSREKRFLTFSIISFALGLLSSEKAIIFPIILFFFVLSFEKISKQWKKLVPFFGIAFLFGLTLFSAVGQRTTVLQSEYQASIQHSPFLQIPIAISSYLELIVWPKNLTLYHSEMTFSQNEFLIRSITLIVFIGFIIYSFYKRQKFVFFWLSFFLISLLPMLTPFGLSWVVAERYVYLGSIGIFAIIALLFKKLIGKKRLKPWFTGLFVLIIISLSIRTIVRNIDWKNQDNLWLAAAKTSPSSPQNRNNLGDLYGRRGDFKRAIEEFQIAIQLKPNYADAYHNLANVYQQINQLDLAIAHYQKALKFNPGLWSSHQQLAIIYLKQKEIDLAKEELQKVLEINPNDQQTKKLLLML